MFDPNPKAIHLLTDKFPNQNNNLSYFDVQSDIKNHSNQYWILWKIVISNGILPDVLDV